jgi:hypothetical protein
MLLHELLAAHAHPRGLIRVEGHRRASQARAQDDAPPVTGLDRKDVYLALDLGGGDASLGHDRP